MRITIATPLFPPDIEYTAEYAYTLAATLAEQHTVTVVLYGEQPEPLPSAALRPVSKQRTAPARVLAFARELRRATREADLTICINGPSVELPTLLVSLATRTPLVFNENDAPALQRSEQHAMYRAILGSVRRRARACMTDRPPARPLVLPTAPYPSAAMDAYTSAWREHLTHLDTILSYVTT